MPHPPTPYNLVFWGEFDLTHPHVILNLIQSAVIFVLEGLHLLTSPFPVTRKDVVRLQIFLPIVSYIIFSYLPAGKKLFVITTLVFSIFFTIFRHLYHLFIKTFKEPKPTVASEAEPPVDGPSAPSSVASEVKTE
jgi:hypothetical protein